MQCRRCSRLLLDLREVPEFRLDLLMQGGTGVAFVARTFALAPHLGVEVELDADEARVLSALQPHHEQSRTELVEQHGETVVDRLLESGLLLGDHPKHAELRARDDAFARVDWWTPAAVAHSFGRWREVDAQAAIDRDGPGTTAKMIEEQGPPPPETWALRPRETWQALPAPKKTALDDLLAGRTTCRNFDPDFHLPLADASAILHRVFAAQAQHELAPGAVALKKNSPSGGGLHPIEAFVLAQRVDGLAPGVYHYHTTGHALEPLTALSTDEAAALAQRLVAGQTWFASAPLLVLLAARFQRNFWKYRNHSKAWRVIQLDAGHLSQNFYLSATEFGYGAFITGAINDDVAERACELDGISTGALAVCGLGRRSADIITVELDPLGKAVGKRFAAAT
jgi:putative peptide maturation dehydrogenase